MSKSTETTKPQQTWHDPETNLTWELKTPENVNHRYVMKKEYIKHAWSPESLTDDVKDAQSYAEKLNNQNFGGFSDWRLPTLDELKDLYSKREIIEKGETCTTTSFTNNTNGYSRWYGTHTSDNRCINYYVRCVR